MVDEVNLKWGRYLQDKRLDMNSIFQLIQVHPLVDLTRDGEGAGAGE